MPSEDELRELLHRGAETIHLEGRGPTAARARAAQRRRRHVGSVSLVAGLLVGAGVVGWTSWRDDPSTEIQIRQADDIGDAVEDLGTTEFEWTPATDVLTFLRDSGVASDGSFFALSTAPGVRWEDLPVDTFSAPEAVYRSDDLLTWESVEIDGSWLADLDATAGLLHAVGTTPATEGEEGQPRVSTSADGGETWEHTPLPVSLSVGPDQPLYTSGRTRIAASGDTVVAMSAMRLFPDLDVLDPTASSWEETPDGLQLLEWVLDPDCAELVDTVPPTTVPPTTVPLTTAPATTSTTGPGLAEEPVTTEAPPGYECEEAVPGRFVPWSDLGVSGAGDLAATDLFVSTDAGDNWERADSAALSEIAIERIDRTANGFVAWGPHREGAGVGLFRSPDGITWTEIAPPAPAAGWFRTVGVVSDRVVVIMEETDGSASVHVGAVDGSGWTSQSFVDDDGAPVWISAAGVGPLGIAVTAAPQQPDPGGPGSTGLWFSADGTAWSTVDLPPSVAATRFGTINWITVGTDRIGLSAVVAGEDGPEPVTEGWVATPIR
ncbi:MAG: hypothetical protein AAGA17_02840 [Actinomycetota bacterium]